MNQKYLQALLLSCLRVVDDGNVHAKLSRLMVDDWTQFLRLAQQQSVIPLLYHRLDCKGFLALLPACIRQPMQACYYGNSVRNLRITQQRDAILTQLRSRNVPVIVLKGGWLSATAYGNPALRVMNDIDLLVEKEHLPDTLAALRELNYAAEDAMATIDPDRHYHLPRFVKPDVVAAVEIHWSITPPVRYSPFDMTALWTHAVSVNLAEDTMLGLCPEDLLLHICIHATYHHLFMQGVRFLCDVDAIVRQDGTPINWTQVQQQTQDRGWSKGVYVALYLTQQLLATPIPDGLLQALRPLEFDTEVMQMAITYMFMEHASMPQLSDDFVKLWNAQSMPARMKILWRRIFLPRQSIIRFYRVPADSYRVYLYYLLHYKNLIERYWAKQWRLWRGDQTLLVSGKLRVELLEWFEQN